jgi:hypothetical protein
MPHEELRKGLFFFRLRPSDFGSAHRWLGRSAGKRIVPIRSKAKNAVLAEWDSWSMLNPGDTAAHAVRFHSHLLENRPDLLDFRYSTADKSQLIQSWLLTARRIKSSS